MALPFLKSDKRDGLLALKERLMGPAEGGKTSGEPGPAAPKPGAKPTARGAAEIAKLAQTGEAPAPARPDRPLPSLTAINGGQTAIDLDPATAAVRARLAALRNPAASAPAPRSEPAISVARYAKSMRERSRAAQYDRTKAMVGKIEQDEIDMLIELGARTRARYISKLLEIGRSNKPLSFSASEEVRGLREQQEEIERGLEILRDALERGEIEIAGVELV